MQAYKLNIVDVDNPACKISTQILNAAAWMICVALVLRMRVALLAMRDR